MKGEAGFQLSAMNGAGLEVLGQVFRSLFKPRLRILILQAGLIYSTMGCSHTAPEASLPFATHPGGGWRFLSPAGIFAPHPQCEIRGLKLSLYIITTQTTPDCVLSPALITYSPAPS